MSRRMWRSYEAASGLFSGSTGTSDGKTEKWHWITRLFMICVMAAALCVINVGATMQTFALEAAGTPGSSFFAVVFEKTLQTTVLTADRETLSVTVTYDQSAGIPEGSTLRVTEFSEDDEEYEYARNSALADKKARGEWVDLSSFCLAALDISILSISLHRSRMRAGMI